VAMSVLRKDSGKFNKSKHRL